MPCMELYFLELNFISSITSRLDPLLLRAPRPYLEIKAAQIKSELINKHHKDNANNAHHVKSKKGITKSSIADILNDTRLEGE